MSERKGDWILTHTGKKFYVQDPRLEDVCLEDIAHALANVCRFGGHSNAFYSVAQHSCVVADNAPKELKLAALLHDATEAYIGDLVRPLKYADALGGFREAEDKIWQAICERFVIDPNVLPLLKTLDNRALMTERRDIMPKSSHKWSVTERPFDQVIEPLLPAKAKEEFLWRFVYVDAERERMTSARWPFPTSCHLFTEIGNEEMLHMVARSLGLKREWFQNDPRLPHYDLNKSKRAAAVAMDVTEVPDEVTLRIMGEHRALLVTEQLPGCLQPA